MRERLERVVRGVAALWLVSGIAVAGGAAGEMNEDIIFDGFTDPTGLVLNGSAAVVDSSDGAVLRLTPARGGQAGSAFSAAQVDATDFSSFFQFRITDPGGATFDNNDEPGADGLVFVVQSVSNSIGGSGQSIGYGGIDSSIGVEFDNWGNAGNNDPSQSHVAIVRDGSVNHASPQNAALPTADFLDPEFDDGDLWSVWVDYDGETLEVRVSLSDARPQDATLSTQLDLVSILGQDTAFVGFTSGTGAAWANHDIVNWRYTGFIPSPATASLLGLSGLVALRRRR